MATRARHTKALAFLGIFFRNIREESKSFRFAGKQAAL